MADLAQKIGDAETKGFALSRSMSSNVSEDKNIVDSIKDNSDIELKSYLIKILDLQGVF